MPNVIDKRTGKVIKEFGYTEDDRDAAEAFASRSEHYIVGDQSMLKHPGKSYQPAFLDPPRGKGGPRLDINFREDIAPTVPGGNPIAGMVNPNPITSVDPATAQLAMQRGAPTQQFQRGETSRDLGGGVGMVPTMPRNVGDPILDTQQGPIRRDLKPVGRSGTLRRPAPTMEEIQRRLLQLQQQGRPLGPQG